LFKCAGSTNRWTQVTTPDRTSSLIHCLLLRCCLLQTTKPIQVCSVNELVDATNNPLPHIFAHSRPAAVLPPAAAAAVLLLQTTKPIQVRWVNELVDSSNNSLPHILADQLDATLHW
jgi:hypothetical protein